ncbi:MAG: hypothetical protein ACK4RS_03110, partial [Thiothrix sp.]
QTFNTTLTLPPGKSYLMLEAKATAAGTYQNQAQFTVNGNTYLSDDPASTGATDPTPVVVSAPPYPTANVSVSMTADKAVVQQHDTFVYTVTFNNQETAPVKVDFRTAPWAGATFVADSLTNPNGGTVLGDYATENQLQIMGMTLPVGVSTLSIRVNSNDVAVGTKMVVAAEITPQDTPVHYLPKPLQSNTTQVEVVATVSSEDTDGDGLNDAQETALGTDPHQADTDADGKLDKDEIGNATAHPLDTDGDGKIDALESATLDDDNDGVVNELDADDTNPSNDSDSDGFSNLVEKQAGTNPLDASSQPAIPPQITSATSVSFVENGTDPVTTVTATSSNGALTYALDNSSVSDNAWFNLDATSGVLTFKAPPDYEAPKDSNKDNAYIVVVKVCDAGNACTPHVIIVSVTSVEEPVLEYSIRRDAGSNRYRVYMRPQVTPAKNLSMTGQITLKVPTGTGTNQFVINELKSAVAGITWTLDSRSNAPSEAPDFDYLSFTFAPIGTSAFNWQAGKELEVFSFTNDNTCDGAVSVMENTDPFNHLPNSATVNPGNQFNNSGWGAVGENHYLGNYGTPQDCSTTNGVKLQVRAFLQGAYNRTNGLMHDMLRVKGLLPDDQPYSGAPWHYAGTETLAVAVKATSGADAVTDWVLVELRDPLLAGKVVATKAAVVQRDGDIVDAGTGENTLFFSGLKAGLYHVAVRHRNHLGIQTQSALLLNSNDVKSVDFTLPVTPTF